MATTQERAAGTTAEPKAEATQACPTASALDYVHISLEGLTYSNPMPSSCAGCGKSRGEKDKALLDCAQCKLAAYCSKGCQKSHWKEHKCTCDIVQKSTDPGATPNLTVLRKLAIADHSLRSTTSSTTGQGVLLKPWVAHPDGAIVDNIHCGYAAIKTVPKACYQGDNANVWNVGIAQAVGFPLLMMRVQEKSSELDKHLPDQSREVGGLTKDNQDVANMLAALMLIDIVPGSPTFFQLPDIYPTGDFGLVRSDGKPIDYRQIVFLVHYHQFVLEMLASANEHLLDTPEQLQATHLVCISPEVFIATFKAKKTRSLMAKDPHVTRLFDVECPVDEESIGRTSRLPSMVKWHHAMARDVAKRKPFLWEEVLLVPDEEIHLKYHQE